MISRYSKLRTLVFVRAANTMPIDIQNHNQLTFK